MKKISDYLKTDVLYYDQHIYDESGNYIGKHRHGEVWCGSLVMILEPDKMYVK